MLRALKWAVRSYLRAHARMSRLNVRASRSAPVGPEARNGLVQRAFARRFRCRRQDLLNLRRAPPAIFLAASPSRPALFTHVTQGSGDDATSMVAVESWTEIPLLRRRGHVLVSGPPFALLVARRARDHTKSIRRTWAWRPISRGSSTFIVASMRRPQ